MPPQQKRPQPRPQQSMCVSIMNQRIRARLGAAIGMGMHVQIHHAAATLRKMIVVGIVNGKEASASQQC